MINFAKYKDKSVLCRKVHDWLTMHVQYDRDEVEKDVYKQRNHSIIGALIERRAVCEGISFAYQYILNRLGIDCMTVSGKVLKFEGKYYKNHHAWNIISLNGKNYHVDVTWNNPIEINGVKHPTYGYFCLPSSLFQDHASGFNIKCNSLDENLFYRANKLFTSIQQLKRFAMQRNPYNYCMIYVANLSHEEVNSVFQKNGRYKYRIRYNTQWQQSGMIVLMK